MRSISNRIQYKNMCSCLIDTLNVNVIYLDKYIDKVYNINMEARTMEEIKRLQDNLLLIRRAVGWTAEEFGSQIGVTRQTINNIESGRNKLNKTQYIAMRSVLDAEMVRCPKETDMLRLLLDVFVDHPNNYKDKDRKELLDKANLVSPSILAGTASREAVSQEWMKTAGAIGLVVGATVAAMPLGLAGGAGAVSAWLAKLIKSSDKKKK